MIGHGARKRFHSILSPAVREIHLGVAVVFKDSHQIDDRSKGDLAHLRQGRGQSKTLNAIESFTASKCVEEHSHANIARQSPSGHFRATSAFSPKSAMSINGFTNAPPMWLGLKQKNIVWCKSASSTAFPGGLAPGMRPNGWGRNLNRAEKQILKRHPHVMFL